MNDQQTQSIFDSKWRIWVALVAIVLVNVVIFALVAGASPQRVEAQGDDDTKLTPIDFYPAPFEGGAMAYSLRDPWPKTDLTFFFHNCPSRLDCDNAQNALRRAFQTWADVSALTFAEVATVTQADIEVTFTSNDPEGVLGTPGDVLAYNYFPRYGGDMFIDDSEPWTIGDGGDFDLLLAAIHEIGHGIGLDHSEFKDAIMYPYSGFAGGLGEDDIMAVQELYGPPDATTPPESTETEANFTPVGRIDTVMVDNHEVKGTINNLSPYNIWTLEVERGRTVTITMFQASGDLDPYVGILTQDLSQVLVENDNWADDNARVVYTFEEGGTYSIVATRFGFEDGGTSGTYSLSVQSTTSSPDTPSDERPAAPQNIRWRVTNFSGFELCEIYFSPSTSTTWGENQIAIANVEPLQDGFYYEWEQPPDTYDIQVWDCFENHLEFYNINAARDVDVHIFQNYIAVEGLAAEPDSTETAATETFIWRVSNYTDFEICSIYFSPTTDDNWRVDQTPDEILKPGFYYQWELSPDSYDLRIEYCDGDIQELYEIALFRDLELAVTTVRINPRPLE